MHISYALSDVHSPTPPSSRMIPSSISGWNLISVTVDSRDARRRVTATPAHPPGTVPPGLAATSGLAAAGLARRRLLAIARRLALPSVRRRPPSASSSAASSDEVSASISDAEISDCVGEEAIGGAPGGGGGAPGGGGAHEPRPPVRTWTIGLIGGAPGGGGGGGGA